MLYDDVNPYSLAELLDCITRRNKFNQESVLYVGITTVSASAKDCQKNLGRF